MWSFAKRSLTLFFSTLQTGPVLVLIQAIGLILWWVAGSYFGIDTFASRSFFGADGHCDPQTQGLGVHCWGDYYYPIFLANLDNPFDGTYPSAYPAAALIPFVFFSWLSEISGLAHIGIFLYLATMVASIGWSVWVGTRGLSKELRLVTFTALTFLAPPVVIALDRGNSVGFIAPLLIWFILSIEKSKSASILLSVVLLAAIKPHFALLTFLLLMIGRKRESYLSLAGILVSNFLPYVTLWLDNFPENLPQSLSRVLSFQEWSSAIQFFPTNLSFSHGVFVAGQILGAVFTGVDGVITEIIDPIQGLIGFFVLALVLILLVIHKSKLSHSQLFVLMVSAISLTSSTTYSYYTLFAIPALISLSREQVLEVVSANAVSTNSRIVGVKSVSMLLWVASIFTLTQWPIFGISNGNLVLTTHSLVGLVWMMTFVLVFFILAYRKLVLNKPGGLS